MESEDNLEDIVNIIMGDIRKNADRSIREVVRESRIDIPIWRTMVDQISSVVEPLVKAEELAEELNEE